MAITQNTYTGDGQTTAFSITFEYIDQSDVKVTVDDVLQTTEYSFDNATQISFSFPPLAGEAVRIFRDTNIDQLNSTFFPGSAIKAEDLNNNFVQNLFVTQESENKVDQALVDVASANTKGDLALTNSRESDGAGGFNSAIDIANAASTSAASAVSQASTAVSTSNQADYNAGLALSNSRIQVPGQPAGTYYLAITLAVDAINQSNTAILNSTATDGNGNIISAVNVAQSAAALATQSAALVSAVLPLTLVANLATLNGLTPNTNDTAEITDSTGISSGTSGFTGIPGTFTGSSSLALRVRYDGTDWNYLSYFNIDPDNNYISKEQVAAVIPAGTTAQRPSSPAEGFLRYNTDLDVFEGYVNSTWKDVSAGSDSPVFTGTPTISGTVQNVSTDDNSIATTEWVKDHFEDAFPVYSVSNLGQVIHNDSSVEFKTQLDNSQNRKAANTIYVDNQIDYRKGEVINLGGGQADEHRRYWVDTRSGARNVLLPTVNANYEDGFEFVLIDRYGTWATNPATLVANGGEKIMGSANNYVLDVDYAVVTVLWTDEDGTGEPGFIIY
tara:strand:+ start:2309 stop:3982 length:1674 start_codon:yes stop_codon:yes gene_type:complete